MWWSSSGPLRSGLSLWIRWRELGGEREERECSGLLADRAYREPAGLSSLRGDPATHTHTQELSVLCIRLLHFRREGGGKYNVCCGSETKDSRAHPADSFLDDGQETGVEVTG